MKRRAWPASLVLLLVLGSVVSMPTPGAGQPAATLVFVRSADSNFVDTGFTTITEDADVAVNVFDSLLRMDATGNVVPGLATSWEHSQGKVWTFNLRRDAKFHDGTLVDAEAVAFSLNRLNPDSPFYHKGRTSSLRIWLRDLIVSAEALDSGTVRVSLKEPYALLAHMLGAWPAPIVSPTAVKRLGESFAQKPVGSGPFKLGEWVKDDHLTLVANKDYWGGAPKLEQVIFKVVPDPSSRFLELKRGSGHFLKGMAPDQRQAVEADRASCS